MAKSLSFSTSALPAIVRLLFDKAPTTTLSGLLADPSIGEQARSLTLADLTRVLGDGGDGPAPRHTTDTETSAQTQPAQRRPRQLRPRTVSTANGKYDAAVLVQILAAPDPIGAVAVREKVGGSPAQFRSAVERLIAARKISKSGVAKGTRYRVA